MLGADDVPHRGISIHALREEGDYTSSRQPVYAEQFLSTPSARRATLSSYCRVWQREYFYPRPPRGGRPRQIFHRAVGELISIHALREEGDPGRKRSRHPASISIHALREEGDELDDADEPAADISIHALREEGDSSRKFSIGQPKEFLSTPSARRATYSHRAERRVRGYFYPRPPRGGRHTCSTL